MEQQNTRYQEGFNNGYLLAKYEPLLLDKLAKQLSSENDYLEGIFDGKGEYDIERFQIETNELKNIRNNATDHDHNLDKE